MPTRLDSTALPLRHISSVAGLPTRLLCLLRLLLLLLPCHLQGSTFGIPGVEQHAHFLRDVRHAEDIRSKLIENIALAGVPGQLTVSLSGVFCTTNHAAPCYNSAGKLLLQLHRFWLPTKQRLC